MSLPKTYRRGESLIGILIALGIFLILSQAVLVLAFSIYDLVSHSRAKISARHIALESMEIIRNAPYEHIGTVGGIPPGIFTQEQQIFRNGQAYTIRTTIVYIDDPFDGLAPEDLLPNDYKRVRIDVSWGGIAASRFSEVTLVSDVAPRGIETIEGSGTLSLLIFDANGQPVPQAVVQISAPEADPPVNATYLSNNTGRVTLPGAPACTSCYQISVSKAGMSTDRTYSTAEIENPTRPHVTIIEGQLTETSFTIDVFARLDVRTLTVSEDEFPALPNQIIRLRGDKVIGTNYLDEPVYKFDLELVTDGNGELSIEELEWDNYRVLLPEDSTNVIVAINPLSPFSVLPGSDAGLDVVLTSAVDHSLRASFEDGDGLALEGVFVTISDGEGFEETLETGPATQPNFGQVFFGNIESGLHTLTATASGYLDYSTGVNIVGNIYERLLLSTE